MECKLSMDKCSNTLITKMKKKKTQKLKVQKSLTHLQHEDVWGRLLLLQVGILEIEVDFSKKTEKNGKRKSAHKICKENVGATLGVNFTSHVQ